ncbi:hypothetical protein Q31b_07930 [Novipirellula aureliae]|uniref:Uncharacterized protein n=1 Tax=Novipirellula aureliae TaxID=2527966 RepID=A0A5C6ECG1_9BACT|nr:hypothetical protein Q31b_07930 [Novipirellula aureliae]
MRRRSRSDFDDIHESTRHRHRAKMQKNESSIAYSRRHHFGETPFAVIMVMFDLRCFLLRGIERVEQEWQWVSRRNQQSANAKMANSQSVSPRIHTNPFALMSYSNDEPSHESSGIAFNVSERRCYCWWCERCVAFNVSERRCYRWWCERCVRSTSRRDAATVGGVIDALRSAARRDAATVGGVKDACVQRLGETLLLLVV